MAIIKLLFFKQIIFYYRAAPPPLILLLFIASSGGPHLPLENFFYNPTNHWPLIDEEEQQWNSIIFTVR